MSYRLLRELKDNVKMFSMMKVCLFVTMYVILVGLSGCSSDTTTRTLYNSEDIKNSLNRDESLNDTIDKSTDGDNVYKDGDKKVISNKPIEETAEPTKEVKPNTPNDSNGTNELYGGHIASTNNDANDGQDSHNENPPNSANGANAVNDSNNTHGMDESNDAFNAFDAFGANEKNDSNSRNDINEANEPNENNNKYTDHERKTYSSGIRNRKRAICCYWNRHRKDS